MTRLGISLFQLKENRFSSLAIQIVMSTGKIQEVNLWKDVIWPGFSFMTDSLVSILCVMELGLLRYNRLFRNYESHIEFS